MKITLETQSPLLSASGESTSFIDADVKYDNYGFPYIQARTFKGLMRESALEVCEILGAGKEKVNELFGLKGNKESGKLVFNNLVIKDYEIITVELEKSGNILSSNSIRKNFTETRQQTSIENGIAMNTSLRKYRLIREGIEFETNIENVPSEDQNFLEDVLALTIFRIRYEDSIANRFL